MIFERLPKGGWYFVGIGGVSMSALAEILFRHGISVRGSDDRESAFTRKLIRLRIPVTIGTDDAITEENVVFTGAVDRSHPQLAAAIGAGKRLYRRAELLGMIAEEYPFVISVAGCHGKTSTTSMLAHIFYENGRAFTSHVGGEDGVLSNTCVRGGDYFLTEACEFQRSFLSLKSTVAVVLNTDRDHTDCYASDSELFSAYREFAGNAELVVVNAEERGRDIPHKLSFGFRAGDVRAVNLRSDGEIYSFTVQECGSETVRVRLKVVGKYQVQNALAAYCAARLSGFTAEEIARGLNSFYGVRRRFEKVGTIGGVPVVCDYAHHPQEIAAVLKSAKRICDGRLHVVFQPHTFTRTRDFMKEFISVFSKEDGLIIYKTYSAREAFCFEGSAVCLASKIEGARYEQSPERLRARLEEVLEKDDLILVLGAGDIYDIVKEIVD